MLIKSEIFFFLHLPVRWVLYLGAVTVIMVFGTYGWGYDANDFIYGGF